MKLLRKSLLYRLFDNIDSLLSETKLTHRELSNRMGSNDNWFNDAYNNNEDIYISSFTRILSVIQKKMDLDDYKLIEVFDDKILRIAFLIGRLSDEEDADYINEFIFSEKIIFIDLLGDWASMIYRNKLSKSEEKVVGQLKILISKNGEGEINA